MNDEARSRQRRLLFIFLCILIFGGGAVSFWIFHNEFSSKPQTITTMLPIDKSNPQELWMNRVESDRMLTDQKLKYLEELVLEKKKHEEDQEKENLLLRQEIQKCKKQLQQIADRPQVQPEIQTSQVIVANDPFSPAVQSIQPITIPRIPLTELILNEPQEKLSHVDQVIPAGTSVKAILVSSVDMPCGVYNSSDPQPIKLRLIDDGRLPKKVRAKLKGGILIASAYGDLSNERVYIRLERLTQVRSDGMFIETQVAGFVTGEDGKYGVKGIVVDKSYSMVENAAISGSFSGLNQYLQATATRNCNFYEPGYTISAGDMASSGASAGASSAFDMLTNYYIKRAEQIRPVIQATAGRKVDVTFIHGFEFGDLHVQDKVRNLRDNQGGR